MCAEEASGGRVNAHAGVHAQKEITTPALIDEVMISWEVHSAKECRVSGTDQNNGDDGGANIAGTNDGGVQKGSISTITQDIKELGGVEHDGVDAGELLEEGSQQSSSLQSQRCSKVLPNSTCNM